MSGRPPSSCSTFARSERMRVPSPAASTMAPSGRAVDTDARVSQPADLFSRRSRPFLATRCGFSHNATREAAGESHGGGGAGRRGMRLAHPSHAPGPAGAGGGGSGLESFPAVFGLGGSGSKLYEGDLRTPTGLYMIVDKRRHPRWGHFLLLDYPNLQDLHRYWIAMEAGTIPRRGDGYAGVGGAVGIHGTDKPGLNRRGVDWTWGCVSLANADVARLARLVPVGTLVLIED
ncbi:MAG: L,D-transpeptidase [Deltaproteobacteria bacterium]|nr:MAG: L,D-transpeptidase [Deltaproteobacteria bacterium]